MSRTSLVLLFLLITYCTPKPAPDPMEPFLSRAEPSQVYDIAVVGGGAAGTSAALRGVLNNDRVLMFTGARKSVKKARATFVKQIDNYPGVAHLPRAISDLRAQTLKQIDESEFRDQLAVLPRTVEQVKRFDDRFELVTDAGEVFQARYVIIATGVMDRQPVIGGNHRKIVGFANQQLVYYCTRCDGHRTKGHATAVIGHSMEAAQVAMMLKERYALPALAVLTHGQKPEWGQETQRLLDAKGIAVHMNEITAIEGDAKAKDLRGFSLAGGQLVDAERAVVSLGLIVYNKLPKQLGAKLDSRGLVLVDGTQESSVPGVYIAGDLASGSMNQVYVGFAQGTRAADAINRQLRIGRRKV